MTRACCCTSCTRSPMTATVSRSCCSAPRTSRAICSIAMSMSRWRASGWRRGMGGRHADRRLPDRVQPALVAPAPRAERGGAPDQRRPRCGGGRGPRRTDGSGCTSRAAGWCGSIRCCANEGFEARPAGIRAMLPHVDDFLPVHNLESLTDLAAALGRPAPRSGMTGCRREARSEALQNRGQPWTASISRC